MNKKFILYIKKECCFCTKAVKKLRDENIDFKTFLLDWRPLVWEELKDIYGWQTVPMVFEVTDEKTYKLLGGYTDLIERLDIEE